MQAPPQRNVAGNRSWRVIAVIVDYNFVIDLEHCPVVRIHDELVEIIRIDFQEAKSLLSRQPGVAPSQAQADILTCAASTCLASGTTSTTG